MTTQDIQPETAAENAQASVQSIVYYIRRGRVIKIGTTTSPVMRFTSLMPDEILAFEPGGPREEAARHLQFSHLRRNGEHFKPALDLDEHIRELRRVHGDPDPSWPTTAKLEEPTRKKSSWCSQHHQERSECPPSARHTYSIRQRGDLMAEVGRRALEEGIDVNMFITLALEERTGSACGNCAISAQRAANAEDELRKAQAELTRVRTALRDVRRRIRRFAEDGDGNDDQA